MLAELLPILERAQVKMTIDQVGDDVVCIVQAIVKNDKLTDEDKQALTGTRTLRYKIAELDPEQVANDLLDWENVVLDGEQQLEDIEETIKKRVATKKAKSTPAKKTHAKPKPKKKTQAELREEMREKQAKEKAGQADLFAEGDRLKEEKVEKTPVKNKEELKTAAEKALERSSAEEEAEDIATAVDNKTPSLDDL